MSTPKRFLTFELIGWKLRIDIDLRRCVEGLLKREGSLANVPTTTPKAKPRPSRSRIPKDTPATTKATGPATLAPPIPIK